MDWWDENGQKSKEALDLDAVRIHVVLVREHPSVDVRVRVDEDRSE